MPKVFGRKIFTRKGLEAETTAYLAQLATLPSAGYINNLNILIKTLKADGNWAELDRLWIFATEIQAHARVSLVNPTSTAITEVNSPTWTIRQGYTGNGTTMYLDSNYNPSTQGVKFTQNSASVFSYYRSNVNSNQYIFGSDDTTTRLGIRPRVTDLFSTIVNAGVGTNIANTDSRGLFSAVRTGSVTLEFFKNGITMGTDSPASNGVSNLNVWALGRNQNGVLNSPASGNLSMLALGSSSMNHPKFYYAIQNFMLSQGANV